MQFMKTLVFVNNPCMFCYFQSEEPPFSVLHILYPDWPDYGVPKDTAAVREIFQRVSAVPPSLGPIVVHCRSEFYSDIHKM